MYVSLADYCAMSETEVSIKERDLVELLKVGCAGWWFVKLLGNVSCLLYFIDCSVSLFCFSVYCGLWTMGRGS